MATVEFPEALFERVHAGNCVLCTGVRFASAAGMPDWDTLFSRMSKKLGGGDAILEQLIREGKLLTVAGYLKRKLGVDSWAEVIREAYGAPAEPPQTHQILGELPFHAAVTTGYDALLERALARNGAHPKVYTYADGAVLRLSEDLDNFVLKAHGDVGHMEQLDKKLVQSRLDYKRLIGPNHAFRAFVEDLYRTHTLLIVGFRMADPDFVLLLEQLSSFRDAVTDHYAILTGVTQPEAEELYANCRIRVINYEEGDDPMASLLAILTDLRDQWRNKGAELPGPEDPKQQLEWLKMQLAPVELRIDMIPAQGLELSESRLNAVRSTSARTNLADVDPETLVRLGNVNLVFEDVPGAIACYNTALAQRSEMYEAHLGLHVAYAEAKQLSESLDHLKQAMELSPTLLVVPTRYELDSVIGRGSTGSIYHGMDTEENRAVTLKVLRTSYLQEHGSPERWLKETEPLKRLDHPNLAKVYEVLVEFGKCILVTEGLSGQSLSRLLREGPLSPDATAQILEQVCAGLSHAHQQGLHHLDLTPSNIFLRDDGSVAVMDFRPGRAQKGRQPSVHKGLEGFQAPELLAGAGGDARSDIYSLGALLYHMLTGQKPIGSFPKLGELAPVARRYDPLVNKALRALPNERPQTVEEFAKALAGKSEAVELPDSEDDLMGWLEVLNFQPDNPRAAAALGKLEQRYREESDWDGLVTLILGRVEFETDAEARITMFKELASIFEKEVGDLGKAFAALKEAFRENTSNLEIRKDLERLAGATGMWNELLQEYSILVQNLRDPKVACDWWVRIGQLYSSELGHDDYAIASFNQALTLDTNRVDAMAELSEVVKRKGDHKEVARLLKRQVDLEEDAARKAELLKELGRVYIRDLGSDEEAIVIYRSILGLDPAHSAAIAALEGLYRKQEMWEELVQLLRNQIEIAEEAEALIRYRRSLAEILGEKLGRQDEAIAQHQKLLEADPDDLDSLKSLERLYDATGRNEEYLAILEKRIDAAGTDQEKAALCRRMASEWAEQPNGQAKAAEYLEKVVEYTGGDDKTFQALTRSYWALGEYRRLADAYNRQIEITSDVHARGGLFAALGKVYEDHLEDPGAAIGVFNNLLSLEEDNKIALSALARLYEKTGVWVQAVQMLERLSTKEEDVDRQVELFHRIGVIQHENLGKDDEAEVSFSKALELKDDHVPSMMALASLYRKRKDYGKAARMLRDAARNTANELEKVKRLYQSGATYEDDIADMAKAQEVYEELIAIDPEHVQTGERLLEIYEKREQWEQAESVGEMLVRKADPKGRGILIDLNLRLGQVSLKCEHEDKALAAFRSAYDLDPTNQRTLKELASLLYVRHEYEEAGKLFQALLVHRRDTLEADAIVDVFYRLGEIKKTMGEESKALNMYEKALDIEPTNPRVLERAIALYQAKEDFEAVFRCKRNILKGTEEEEARLALAEEIGDLLQEKLRRYNEAITYYKMVTETKPDHRRVLNKIMETHILQKKWDEAIVAMGRIEDYETDPEHRSRLHYTAAVIFRDQLGRPKEAAHHFDQALVKDPSNRRAFDSLKKLYREQQNYKGLVKAYRLMLKRLPEETPTEEQVQLWHELGEICQEKLHDAKGAIVAFEVAAKLDPSNEARQERLAQLYITAGPDAYEKAILAHQRRLKSNPLRQEAYKELRRLYAEVGEYDKAWCVAAVLGWLKKASDEEMALYRKHRNETPRRVARKLSDDLWQDHLYHEQQHGVLNEVFAAAAPVMAPMAVRPAKAHNLGEELPIDEDPRPYAKVSEYVSQVMDRSVSRYYLCKETERGRELWPILTGTTEEISTGMKVQPKVVQSESETELHYWFAKALSLLRPEHFLCYATPSPTVLRAVALGVLKAVKPSVRIGGDVDEVTRLAEVFRTDLPANKLDMLAGRSNELRDRSTEQEVGRWIEGVDLSTTRAALLICDDLESAAKLLSTEPVPEMSDHSAKVKQRLQELMVFAVSEDYFKLRELLGLQVR